MSYSINLSENQIKELKNHQKNTQKVQEYKRLQCVYLVHKKYPKGEIAEMFDVSHNTITTWVKLFLDEGFSGLLTINYNLRRKSKLLRFKDEIKEYVDKEVPSKVSQIQDWLENTHNIYVEHSWLYRFLKKNSIYLIKKQG
jgi:transposase